MRAGCSFVWHAGHALGADLVDVSDQLEEPRAGRRLALIAGHEEELRRPAAERGAEPAPCGQESVAELQERAREVRLPVYAGGDRGHVRHGLRRHPAKPAVQLEVHRHVVVQLVVAGWTVENVRESGFRNGHAPSQLQWDFDLRSHVALHLPRPASACPGSVPLLP